MIKPAIELATGSEAEVKTRDWLVRLLEEHEISGWMFSLRVRIEENAIPHSHPVLTIGTRSPHDWALLSSLIHEQIHWLCWERWHESDGALGEITTRYPNPPVGDPDGARNEFSSHLHYLVNFLELEALGQFLGAEKAGEYLRGKPFYRALYATVVDDREWLADLCARHELVLPDRRTGTGAKWYHGSPLELDTLADGSTITRNREIARISSHKPTVVAIADDGDLQHNGETPGYLYRVLDVSYADLEPHPTTTMEPGVEWIAKRSFHLERIQETVPDPREVLSDEEVADLKRQTIRRS
jgi:hypothetical protein